MPGISNNRIVKTISLAVLFCVFVQGQPFLVCPTNESYKQKSHAIGRKLEREFYARSAVLVASVAVSAYALLNFFMGQEKPQPVPSPSGGQDWKWLSRKGLKYMAEWLAKATAQGICVHIISAKIMTNNAEPKVYISKHIYHKIHGAEIDRLLLMRAAEEYLGHDCGYVDILIQGHLQALVDKIELLLAYMTYYGAAHTLPHAYANIEKHATKAIKKVGTIIEQFNTTQADNFVDAVQVCKKECTDLLISSIRYALASLPLNVD